MWQEGNPAGRNGGIDAEKEFVFSVKYFIIPGD